jgi:Trm5-related predicted tRNA methylase
MTQKEKSKILNNMNTEDFNTMREMLSEIEIKIMQLDPIKQRQFYLPIQQIICAAWEDSCNNNDEFIFK